MKKENKNEQHVKIKPLVVETSKLQSSSNSKFIIPKIVLV